MKKFNYENKEYLEKLNELNESYYSKYILFVGKYLKTKNSLFLDVGCGNGFVLTRLKYQGYVNGYGVDISKLFIKDAKSKGLKNVYSFDGSRFPFRENFFDVVGSFNVLEHTQNPELFIKQQISILKKNGYLLIACPNFLSILMPSPHPRIKGFKSRFKNFLRITFKIINRNSVFEKMLPIKRKVFQYDDDAIVVTNIIDLKRILKRYNCRVVYESGFINYNTNLFKIINIIPMIRYMLPSCFVVAQKIK